MKHFTYRTCGTCSQQIDFDYDPEKGTLHNVMFLGGCNGNLQGIGQLAEGEDARRIARKLSGIRCGYKSTSCPDQLARAIAEAVGSADNQ